MSLTKWQIEDLLSDEVKIRKVCIAVIENCKRYFINRFDGQKLALLNKYSPDEYVEFARKNLKEKLSKM